MARTDVFSKNLKRYMEARQKKQADLCKYLKVSSATVSDWCNGKKMPQTKRIGDIAAWLNIQVTDLFDESEPDETKLTIIADDELLSFIEYYKNANPGLRRAALAVLKSEEPPAAVPQKPENTK